jgi:DNA-binding MarR family transcriptional regulator
VSLPVDQDKPAQELQLSLLIGAPTLTRRLYQRGGFEGLEANVLQVLIAVTLTPGSTVGELTETLALAQGTVSTAVTNLSGRALINATADSRDARRQLLRATRAGRLLVERFAATHIVS